MDNQRGPSSFSYIMVTLVHRDGHPVMVSQHMLMIQGDGADMGGDKVVCGARASWRQVHISPNLGLGEDALDIHDVSYVEIGMYTKFQDHWNPGLRVRPRRRHGLSGKLWRWVQCIEHGDR
ncbi:hypothetical protein Dimus_038255 [Dionaea muscipula]